MDVLPDSGLSGDRRGLADGLGLQRVDDGAFADVRVPDEAHADVLLVFVEIIVLPEEIYQGALSEGVCDAGVVRQGGEIVREVLHPGGLRVKGRNLL